ncbi:uncharacterized protein [Macrobrachium rosenbergii]|uniref:uncharacterized protein n=1 Tax=Macrobrachium rosenbergii TaxID=79674 RepID=UPI0034D5EA66
MVKGKIFALNSDEFYFSINQNLVPFEIDSGAAVSTITKEWVFYVVDSCNTNLCGKDLMQQVGIYLAGIDEGTRVIKVANVSAEKLLDNYLVDSNKPIAGVLAKIHLKGNATPKFMKARTVPFYYKKMIEDALDKLVADEMIEPISHSEWAVPIVPVLKENKAVKHFTNKDAVLSQLKNCLKLGWSKEHNMSLLEYVSVMILPISQRPLVDNLIEEMKEDVVVIPSKSPYNSPLLLVLKKDGSWRLVIDYRKLNSNTVPDRIPMRCKNAAHHSAMECLFVPFEHEERSSVEPG